MARATRLFPRRGPSPQGRIATPAGLTAAAIAFSTVSTVIVGPQGNPVVPIRFPPLAAVAASLALVAAALPGCQQSREALAESAIEHAAGRLQVAGDGGRSAVHGAADALAMQRGDALPLPKDFPGDIYL